MEKRGQFTLFIIIGIVIVVAVLLVVFLRGAIMQAAEKQAVSKVTTFAESVDAVERVVDSCLEDSAKKAVAQFGNKKVNDYEGELGQAIQTELYNCADFSSVPAVSVFKKTPEVVVSLPDDRSKILISANFELVVKQGDAEERLNEFFYELKLFSDCCVPVDVDSDCMAKESGEFRVCVSLWDVQEGNSLMSGGECLAC